LFPAPVANAAINRVAISIDLMTHPASCAWSYAEAIADRAGNRIKIVIYGAHGLRTSGLLGQQQKLRYEARGRR
jgi:hypothetical protein